MKITDLKQFLDKTVTLRLTNGETAKVKVDFLDEDSGDLVGAVLETSNPDDYRSACAMHTFPAAEITSAEMAE